MLTARGGWFLVVVVLVLVIGAFAIPYYSVVPALVGVTLLAWFAFEWVLFHTAFERRGVAAPRRAGTSSRAAAKSPCSGRASRSRFASQSRTPARSAIPFAVLEDRRAVATEHVSGSTRAVHRTAGRRARRARLLAEDPFPGRAALRGCEGPRRGLPRLLLPPGVPPRPGRVPRPPAAGRR